MINRVGTQVIAVPERLDTGVTESLNRCSPCPFCLDAIHIDFGCVGMSFLYSAMFGEPRTLRPIVFRGMPNAQ